MSVRTPLERNAGANLAPRVAPHVSSIRGNLVTVRARGGLLAAAAGRAGVENGLGRRRLPGGGGGGTSLSCAEVMASPRVPKVVTMPDNRGVNVCIVSAVPTSVRLCVAAERRKGVGLTEVDLRVGDE